MKEKLYPHFHNKLLNETLYNLSFQHQNLTTTKKQHQKNLIASSRKAASLQNKQNIEHLPQFRNQVKISSLFSPKIQNIPYKFIPKQKAQTLILPDRSRAKGSKAKRFIIKMKDSFPNSFQNNEENYKMKTKLNKQYKDNLIMSRKMEQFCKNIDQNDGRIKKQANLQRMNKKQYLIPNNFSLQYFSIVQPMFETKNQVFRSTAIFNRHSNNNNQFQSNNALFRKTHTSSTTKKLSHKLNSHS